MTRSPRVAAYCRVSSLDQHADIQVEAIRRAASRAGLAPRRRARGRHRLGRSLAHVLKLLDLFSKHGVQFVSLAAAGLDGTTAVGRMTLQLCSVFAEFKRSLLR